MLGRDEDYLRGLECYNRFTKASNRQARQHFESAIARSPDFAAAHHYLGWVHMTDGWFGWSPDREASLSLAIEHADRAIGLDDTHADGYAVRAFVHTLRGDHDRAVVEAERVGRDDRVEGVLGEGQRRKREHGGGSGHRGWEPVMIPAPHRRGA